MKGNRMHNSGTSISLSWLVKMAWRDSRKNRSRLLLFMSSILLGIAALVAIYSFKDNVTKDIEQQAKELTGADLVIGSRRAVADSVQQQLDRLGDDRAEERSFASMIYFVKDGNSRLVQVKALRGNYPFYGSIETLPAEASVQFQQGRNALVDETLLLQFNAQPGDSIRIGELRFKVSGSLQKAPGQTGLSSTVAPIVYIPLAYLEETGLNQTGSRFQYRYYYQFRNASEVEKVVKNLESVAEKEGLDVETVESRKAQTGRSFADLNRFLALTGFIALLLGCIGVGSATHVYMGEKLGAIATLRCLGLKARHAFLIYFIQISFLGLMGGVFGAALGSILQLGLPWVLRDFLPVTIQLQLSWTAILQGVGLGLVISILFSLPSLLGIRRVSPLNAIRASFEQKDVKRDPLLWLVYTGILVFILGFTYLQMRSGTQSLAFTLFIAIAFLLLAGFSKLLMWLLRRFLPASVPYLWRQGFVNLYRPNNQTLMLTVAIGLATTFITTLFLIQDVLINRVKGSSGENQANMVLFDIQSPQKQELAELTRSYQLPLLMQVPIITMRIEEINGKKAGQDSLQNRAFRGEIRATYQDSLTNAEKIVAGKWTGRVSSDREPVYISLEKRYAENIKVNLNDEILFNVQGMLIPTKVGSFREVDWNRMQTNFRVVFPEGVLEAAPQFHVLMTRVPSKEVSANYQRAVVSAFPNISVIDLELVLKLLDELIQKIAFVIRFMAGFSMLTGWVVLISAVRTSKNQRIRESILLRTLGAGRKQIMVIQLAEYFFLGTLAALAGILLAFGASWALSSFSFEAVFQPPLLPIVLLFAGIVFLVVLTGCWGTRKILAQSPLKILRSEN